MLRSDEGMPYDFRNPPPPGPPHGHRPPPGPPPRDYRPGSNLPVYPTYSRQVINGVEYKAYYETDWNQVLTEDGVSLRDLLRTLPVYNKEFYYHYKGVLHNRPDMSAMDQLYNMPHAKPGDVWLVETSMVDQGRFVCEVYVFLGGESGWVFSGSTSRKASVNAALSKTLRLIPAELGEAGQYMIISPDGETITWGDPLKAHDSDEHAHEDIRKMIENIEITAAKLLVMNDLLLSGNWTYNGNNGYYEYVYQNDKIPAKSYFEITPVIEQKEVSRAISLAGMHPTYRICAGEDYPSYAILKSRRVPAINIEISVKVFGGITHPKK